MRNALYILLCTFGLLLSSCGTLKGRGGVAFHSGLKGALEVEKLELDKQQGYRAKVKASLIDGTSEKSMTLSMRMLPDEGILFSAPLGVAKGLVTPSEISFYNKLDRTYYQGSIRVLDSLVSASLEFTHLQRLFLGQALFADDNSVLEAFDLKRVDLKDPDRVRWVKGFRSTIDFPASGTYQILLNSTEKRIESQSFESEGRPTLYVYYQFESEQDLFPSRVTLVARKKRLVLDIEGVSLEGKLSLPFQIPSGYTPLK